MDQARSAVALAQELRADASGLPSLASAMNDKGYHGVDRPSFRTDSDGLSAGTAVLAPSMITIMNPPGRDPPIIYPGRCVAATVAWGCEGGTAAI
eukprot:3134358-Pyramimonas_sp.AAC.1